MSYSDFTFDSVVDTFSIALHQAALFPYGQTTPIEIPAMLQEMLDEGLSLAYVSEKARSELIIMPILLAVRKLMYHKFSLYSGYRFDVDNAAGLVGECDFLLSLSPHLPIVQAPVVTLVVAKKQDIEAGLGQCAAQMIAAQRFNQKKNHPTPVIYGCVTTGAEWQVLMLQEQGITLDSQRYYINDVASILRVLHTMIVKVMPM